MDSMRYPTVGIKAVSFKGSAWLATKMNAWNVSTLPPFKVFLTGVENVLLHNIKTIASTRERKKRERERGKAKAAVDEA